MTDPQDAQPNDAHSDGSHVDDLSYGEALAELEQLLTDLEDADIDVDLLTERVARGAQLVRHCQERLAVVSGEVDDVVRELAATGPPPDTGSAEAESAGEG